VPRCDETEFLNEVLRGDQLAITFVSCLFRIVQLLDDFCDNDAELGTGDAEDLCWLTLCDLPSQPFYIQHFNELQPLIRLGVIDWFDSNKLQHGTDDEKKIAFVLRDTINSIVIHVAGIVGGDEWMRNVSLDIRRHAFEDSFDDFKLSLEKTS
jgi:hypothetical protein